MHTGFHLTLQPTGLQIRKYHPAAPRRRALVGYARKNRIVAVIAGRIHYREELANRFSLDRDTSDAAMVLQLYRKQGAESLRFIEGDFSLCVCDVDQRSAVVQRDSFGRWPLFWCEHEGRLVIGTSARRMAEEARGTTPSSEYLADFLTHPFPGAEIKTSHTAFVGVNRVRAGSIVKLMENSNPTEIWRMDWTKFIGSEQRVSAADAAEGYRHLLDTSVRERLSGEVPIAHLSGGMDSSAVAGIAANIVDSQGEDPLLTQSLVYSEGGLADEKNYIRMMTNGRRMNAVYIDGEQCYDFDGLSEDIPLHDEPYFGVFRFAMESAMAVPGRDHGASIVLTGAGAELTTEWRHHHIPDLLLSGRWHTAIKECQRWSGAKNVSLYQILWQRGVRPLIRPDLLAWKNFGRGGSTTDLNRIGQFSVAPWIRPEFVRAHRMWHRAVEFTKPQRQYPVAVNSRNLELESVAGDWANYHLAAKHGMRISHPFLDPRLIQFSLSLPLDVRSIPGRSKPLLQDAARDVLPEKIRHRRYKQSFNDVFWNGLRRNLGRVQDVFHDSNVDELGLFDVPATLDAFQKHSMGIGGVVVGHRLCGALAVAVWYDQIRNRTDTAEPCEVIEIPINGHVDDSGLQAWSESQVKERVPVANG